MEHLYEPEQMQLDIPWLPTLDSILGASGPGIYLVAIFGESMSMVKQLLSQYKAWVGLEAAIEASLFCADHARNVLMRSDDQRSRGHRIGILPHTSITVNRRDNSKEVADIRSGTSKFRDVNKHVCDNVNSDSCTLKPPVALDDHGLHLLHCDSALSAQSIA